jgi:NADPH-dependent 2,4-dienoyl-CoA reductase/sulfur reductase-like enzyme
MKRFKHVIVGGGMAGASAAAGIREAGDQGSIALFGEETHAPYDRPPLSKALWKGTPLDSIWRKTAELGVDLQPGLGIAAVDPDEKTLTDRNGARYGYEKLLLATGGKPRRLPFDTPTVIYYRTVDDYQKLRQIARDGAHVAVIGGGFIGSEIAAALTMNRVRVTMLFPDASLGARIYPTELSSFVERYYRDKGVTVLTRESVNAIEPSGQQTLVKTASGKAIAADAVVAGLGLQLRTELAEAAGLQVDNGIRVDPFLRTSSPDIYAAGDAANFYAPALDVRLRVEHEDNANTMGKIAGGNMAGREDRYDHLPFFYSDLFELGYEAVGELDARLETVEDWKEPFKKGVIYYLRDEQVRGVLLWNTWNQVDTARQLIASKKLVSHSELIGRITDEG